MNQQPLDQSMIQRIQTRNKAYNDDNLDDDNNGTGEKVTILEN